MPLRLIEATVPNEELEKVPGLLDEIRVIHLWTSGWASEPGPEPELASESASGSRPTSRSADATGLVRVLVDADDAEAASDLLVGRFGSRAGFRLILLPVEATLPAVEEPDDTADAEGDAAEPDKGATQRISREELYDDLGEASKLTRVYVVMVALSTVVAAVGLIRGDVAIIIGAMVIAPLLGPNIALSLASTLGDLHLAKRSLKAMGVGVATAAVLSVLLGAALRVDPSAPQLAARTQAGLGDIALALAAGAAGSLAFTSGVSAVVVGVMVAVALLPPLVVAGLLAGAGHGTLAAGALVLFLTNVTCVNLAAVATFLLRKVRPRTWWEAERAKRATWIAAATWIAMLAILVILMWLGRVEAA